MENQSKGKDQQEQNGDGKGKGVNNTAKPPSKPVTQYSVSSSIQEESK
jgi:hypothetical protein